ncbi:uncharacterized protein LOC129831008 isoform X7 [Salvelinus fontinalis]|uniref:uncharacterized protein LOC129831008 isoform X7 n=1 Tax=Salvelinus fontinalis TaxID=8038 RepID=UPI002486A0E1|nr:uncharacterized protein LOC129831008 isoform X7 [Salvelinus fontinalis]
MAQCLMCFRMTWVQGSKVTRVTRASQGSTDHREREELWSQGQRVNQDLTDPLVYLGKMERSNLRVRLVCKDCEGQRVRGKGIPGESIDYQQLRDSLQGGSEGSGSVGPVK